jgi:serine/threonine protein kinase
MHRTTAVTESAIQRTLKLNYKSSLKKDKESPQKVKKYNKELTVEERTIYEDRFPVGYKKLTLLGKGGCALVWLGTKGEDKVAIKQFARARNLKVDIDSWRTEVEINKILFSSNDASIANIAKCLGVIEELKDVWVVYELGGQSLTKQLFEIKGEFFKGERLYKITHQPLYKQFQTNTQSLKTFIRIILKTLILFNKHKIVHCDLKPDNILIDSEGQVKVIDFGSSFVHSQCGIIRMTTAEYIPPECLELKKLSRESLAEVTQPWSVDMWSLGAILLEIFTGFPQWLSLKGRVEYGNKSIIGLGVFSSNGKVTEKIIQKQREAVKNLHEVLKRYNSFMKDERLIELLTRMLDLNPITRISPKEALNYL